jgi:hypothetical protein
MATIYIPKSVPELIDLSEKILARHYLEGEKSPLRNVNIEQLSVNIDGIKKTHLRYLELKKESDRLKDQIQLALGVHKTHQALQPNTVRFLIIQIRDILKGVKREDVEELGKWGYTVY